MFHTFIINIQDISAKGGLLYIFSLFLFFMMRQTFMAYIEWFKKSHVIYRGDYIPVFKPFKVWHKSLSHHKKRRKYLGGLLWLRHPPLYIKKVSILVKKNITKFMPRYFVYMSVQGLLLAGNYGCVTYASPFPRYASCKINHIRYSPCLSNR